MKEWLCRIPRIKMYDSENAVQTAAIHLTVANENVQNTNGSQEEDQDDPLSSFDDPLGGTVLGGGDFDPLGAIR